MLYDVIVAGAGTTGLMLANHLARHGLSVQVFEQIPGQRPSPRAIGISTPSLEIFRSLGLDAELVRQGVPVRRVLLHGSRRTLGTIDFSGIRSDFRFVLSIPQDRPKAILKAALEKYPNARLSYAHRVTRCADSGDEVTVYGRRGDGAPFEARARFLAACDGGVSVLRDSAGIAFDGAYYRDTFLMGDFADTTPWGADGHVFFTPAGSLESFPLPGGTRRYVVSTPALVTGGEEDFLHREVLRRCGTDLGGAPMHWKLAFKVRRFLASSYWKGRIVLAGDAAHLMSPIIGQNMNTGFADAELLGLALRRILRDGDSAAAWLDFYQRVRMRAARAAAFRAWSVMRLGTVSGAPGSCLRNAAVGGLLHSPARAILPPLFSMMSIPGRNLSALGMRLPGGERA